MTDRRFAVAAAAIAFVIHLIANPHYGFFRDELYFIICGRHPQFGYVDQPPLVPLIAALTQIFGPSLVLLRAVPALCAAASIYVTCRFVAELGGGRFAIVLAAVAAFLSPVLLNFGMKVSPDIVGLWLWPLAALWVMRIVKGADPRLWLAVGAALGVCLESKYSVIFFGVALIAGLFLTPQRSVLASRWFFAGLGVCAMIALPNFLWQAHYGFPMLELLRNGQHGKNVVLGPVQYVLAEILITNPLLALIWIAGLIWLLVVPRFRFLAYAYGLLIVQMIVLHGKHYYPADVYPIMFAAGGVAVERITTRGAIVLRTLTLAFAAAAGLALVPFGLPILSETTFVAYMAKVSSILPARLARTENQRTSVLSQDWADMHGWPELAAAVAGVVDALPPADRAQAVIVASNYGEAAALEFFGSQYNLPPVVSGHNQYWLWGPRGRSGDVLIDVNGDCGRSMHLFRSSRRAATFTSRWGISYEQDLPIMVCRGIRTPLATLWPTLKDYI